MKKNFFPHDHKPDHVKSLDGLRGIAVLIVLFAHSHHVNQDPNFFHYYGRSGVFLFFFLSSYLLDRQIINVLNSDKSSTRYWINYCLRRFFRIYPLFIFALLLYYFIDQNFLGNFINSVDEIIDNLLMLQGSGVFWSIPVEFKYYILSPFIMFGFHKWLKWNLFYITIAILILVGISLVVQLNYRLPWLSTLKVLPIFLAGSLIAIYEKFRKDVYASYSTFLGIFGTAGIIFSNPYFWNIFNKPYYFFVLVNIFTMPIFLGAIFYSVREGFFSRIARFKVFRFIGTISFSVYLFHMLVAYGLQNYGFKSAEVNMVLYFFLSIVLSIIPYIIIEYPLSKVNINSFGKNKKNLVYPSSLLVKNKVQKGILQMKQFTIDRNLK